MMFRLASASGRIEFRTPSTHENQIGMLADILSKAEE